MTWVFALLSSIQPEGAYKSPQVTLHRRKSKNKDCHITSFSEEERTLGRFIGPFRRLYVE